MDERFSQSVKPSNPSTALILYNLMSDILARVSEDPEAEMVCEPLAMNTVASDDNENDEDL